MEMPDGWNVSPVPAPWHWVWFENVFFLENLLLARHCYSNGITKGEGVQSFLRSHET